MSRRSQVSKFILCVKILKWHHKHTRHQHHRQHEGKAWSCQSCLFYICVVNFNKVATSSTYSWQLSGSTFVGQEGRAWGSWGRQASERPWGGNAVSCDGRLTYGNIVEEKSEPKFVTEASDVFWCFWYVDFSCSLIKNSCKWKSFWILRTVQNGAKLINDPAEIFSPS